MFVSVSSNCLRRRRNRNASQKTRRQIPLKIFIPVLYLPNHF